MGARLRNSLAAIVVLAGACTRQHVVVVDADTPPPPDDLAMQLFVDDGGVWTGPCGPEHPCESGLRCFQDRCVADNGTCQTDDECQNDTYCECSDGSGAGGAGDGGSCDEGVCLPWGARSRGLYDPNCRVPGFTPEQFRTPALKCSWTGAGVMSTTVVADLDGDHRPEIIAQTMRKSIVAIHGKDCSLMWEVPIVPMFDWGTVAVADLDGDKRPEVIYDDSMLMVNVLDSRGNPVARSPMAHMGVKHWGGVAIADLDGVSPPEIVAMGQALRYRKGNPSLEVLWTLNPGSPLEGWLPLVARLPLGNQGKPSVVMGRRIYEGLTGKEVTPPALAAFNGDGALTAVGDFNNDGKPDLVVVQSWAQMVKVWIHDLIHDKVIFGPYTFPGMRMGAPTIADFDGDGKPDFATAGNDAYRVYSLKCVGMNRPKVCDQVEEGVLWKKTTKDKSSGVTGSSVFDFNGDGKAEVVYRDECWLRVYNGPDGKTLFATPVSSWTALEEPIIADVDGDGHAEIVVSGDSSNQMLCPRVPEADTNVPYVNDVNGIFVYQDPMRRWMPSRGIWNQHTYHITNVNDDGTIPVVEKDNWLTLNNYRMNVQGSGQRPLDVGDATAGVMTGVDPGSKDCQTAWTLRANVCNRGTNDLEAGLPGTFYTGDPRNGAAMPLCTAVTAELITPAACVTVECDWKDPPGMMVEVWFRANDDGVGGPRTRECKDNNDILHIPGATCRKVQ